MVWPIAEVLTSLFPLPTVGIWGTQASTGDEEAYRAGCESPPADCAKGMEVLILSTFYQKQQKNSTHLWRENSRFVTLNRKMEEAGSGHHPGIEDLDRREQYSHSGLRGLPSSSLARQDTIFCEYSPLYPLLSSKQHCLLRVLERETFIL